MFISLAFRVHLWSVSCCLEANAQQHLITSLGFCLKGHIGAGTNVKLSEGPLAAILFLLGLFFKTLKPSRATAKSELAN